MISNLQKSYKCKNCTKNIHVPFTQMYLLLSLLYHSLHTDLFSKSFVVKLHVLQPFKTASVFLLPLFIFMKTPCGLGHRDIYPKWVLCLLLPGATGVTVTWNKFLLSCHRGSTPIVTNSLGNQFLQSISVSTPNPGRDNQTSLLSPFH